MTCKKDEDMELTAIDMTAYSNYGSMDLLNNEITNAASKNNEGRSKQRAKKQIHLLVFIAVSPSSDNPSRAALIVIERANDS
eukprot:scaffold2148_cov28-Cyclotella_meneghiniana.AAC.2